MDTSEKPMSPTDRTLRCISVWSIIWAIPFLVAYSVCARRALPALCLIPLGFSVAVGIYHLSPVRKNRFVNTALDLVVGFFLLGMLIPANISMSTGWRGNRSLAMVGTYGTVSLIVNIAIHAYFALREMYILKIGSLLFGNMLKSPTCPHCQHEFFSQPGLSGSSSTTSRGSYVAVQTPPEYVEGEPSAAKDRKGEMSEYKDARPSTEDESARLV